MNAELFWTPRLEVNPMIKRTALNKQSKRAQKAYHRKQRGSWNGVNPVTRILPNGRGYDRNRMKRESRNAVD